MCMYVSMFVCMYGRMYNTLWCVACLLHFNANSYFTLFLYYFIFILFCFYDVMCVCCIHACGVEFISSTLSSSRACVNELLTMSLLDDAKGSSRSNSNSNSDSGESAGGGPRLRLISSEQQTVPAACHQLPP